MKQLEGKVALITGGGTGVGKAISLAYARQGAAIAVNYSRSHKEAQQTAQQIRAAGTRAMSVQADVSRDQDVRRMVAETCQQLGRLDILVNSAGTTTYVPHTDLDALTEEIWDQVLGVNLKGLYFCSRAAAGPMREVGRGCIINIASTSAVSAHGSSIAYAASKAGVVSVTKSMARALAPTIQINAISPGVIEDTRWADGWDEFKEQAQKITPMGRIVLTADIAEVALFLAAGSRYITGQNIVVDGGRTM